MPRRTPPMPEIAHQRVIRDSSWFCAPWRGGCGARLETFNPDRDDPCEHCGEHAATRYRIVEPDPQAAP